MDSWIKNLRTTTIRNSRKGASSDSNIRKNSKTNISTEYEKCKDKVQRETNNENVFYKLKEQTPAKLSSSLNNDRISNIGRSTSVENLPRRKGPLRNAVSTETLTKPHNYQKRQGKSPAKTISLLSSPTTAKILTASTPDIRKMSKEERVSRGFIQNKAKSDLKLSIDKPKSKTSRKYLSNQSLNEGFQDDNSNVKEIIKSLSGIFILIFMYILHLVLLGEFFLKLSLVKLD